MMINLTHLNTGGISWRGMPIQAVPGPTMHHHFDTEQHVPLEVGEAGLFR
ncbi:hypothetical protein ACKVEX_12755 [Rhodocyclaceae bacterium SMB388]